MFYHQLNELLQQRYADVDALRHRLYMAAHQIADQFASHIGAPQSTTNPKVPTRPYVFAAPVGGLEELREPEKKSIPAGYEDDRLHFDIFVMLDKPSSWRHPSAVAVTVEVREALSQEIRYKIVDGKAGTDWDDTSNVGGFITRLKSEFEQRVKAAI